MVDITVLFISFVFIVNIKVITSQHCFQNVVHMPAQFNNSVKLIVQKFTINTWYVRQILVRLHT